MPDQEQTILAHSDPDVVGTVVVPSTDPDVLAAYATIGWTPIAGGSLTKAELVDLAAEHGVTVDPSASKADIADALNSGGVAATEV